MDTRPNDAFLLAAAAASQRGEPGGDVSSRGVQQSFDADLSSRPFGSGRPLAALNERELTDRFGAGSGAAEHPAAAVDDLTNRVAEYKEFNAAHVVRLLTACDTSMLPRRVALVEAQRRALGVLVLLLMLALALKTASMLTPDGSERGSGAAS